MANGWPYRSCITASPSPSGATSSPVIIPARAKSSSSSASSACLARRCQIESGRVYIDGQALDEPYVVYPSEESLSIQLEEDQYFIMGDNRAVSLDSRSIGPLSRDQLHGYVLGAVFPFDRFRWFS